MTKGQDTMLERFGPNWATKTYASMEVFRMAEDLAEAIDFIKDVKTAFRENINLKRERDELLKILVSSCGKCTAMVSGEDEECEDCEIQKTIDKYKKES